MNVVWVLVVLVFADGIWREWDHVYTTKEACEEIRQTITHHREKILTAHCESRVK